MPHQTRHASFFDKADPICSVINEAQMQKFQFRAFRLPRPTPSLPTPSSHAAQPRIFKTVTSRMYSYFFDSCTVPRGASQRQMTVPASQQAIIDHGEQGKGKGRTPAKGGGPDQAGGANAR